ncbi:phospholipase d1 [Grosmannia clavigera kw1407]|uniref:Phospholipase D1 n=1 Tax=Grosmannia clavigera (strain kw1407 / UAMH 11150) TaxID=655863 RepID=F0XDV6_GROCL|nr:phospholipase d1 [Grosmannia clavigera kw1407]EFX04791.1 phospholipase d1 [Grosmannia clavigera kw1407]
MLDKTTIPLARTLLDLTVPVTARRVKTSIFPDLCYSSRAFFSLTAVLSTGAQRKAEKNDNTERLESGCTTLDRSRTSLLALQSSWKVLYVFCIRMGTAAEDGSRLSSNSAAKDTDLPSIPEAPSAEAKATSAGNGPANGASYNSEASDADGAPTMKRLSFAMRLPSLRFEAEDYLTGGFAHSMAVSAGDEAAGGTASPGGMSPGISPGAIAGRADGMTTPQILEEGELMESPPGTPGLSARRSVQFSGPDIVVDAPFGSHSRQNSLDAGNPSSSRSRAFMAKLKALAVQGGLPSPRSPGTGSTGMAADTAYSSATGSPTMARGSRRARSLQEEGSDEDADAEETADEDTTEETAAQSKKRRRRTHYRPPPQRLSTSGALSVGGIATEPGTPVPTSNRLQALLQRRATMPDVAQHRGGLSEGEGRDQLDRQHNWRRGSMWMGRSEEHEEADSQGGGRTVGHLRRRTAFGGGASDNEAALTSRRTFFAGGEKATLYGAQKWRQVKNTWKFLRQKREDRFDYLKSAELMAELRAGAPAVLMLASMIQRDEHGNKRIPVLLEQLRLHVSDSTPMQDGDSERHWLFTIDLEYGSGPSRMKWTIKRTIREILELHWKYKLALRNDKYLHTVLPVGSRPKQPRFPVSVFPYVRGLRGLEMDDEDDAGSLHGEDDAADGAADGAGNGATDGPADRGNATAGEMTAGEGTATDVEGGGGMRQRRRTRMTVLGMSRRSSAVIGADGSGLNADGQAAQDEAALRRKYVDRQQRVLGKYLTEMIHWLIFRADSNRLCRFLELSALGVRLAAEGSYHGKECFLHIQSSKGLDFRRVLTPGKVIERHSRKWFLVRQSYIVCVESPENMNIYDVYLVDPKFLIVSKNAKRKQAEAAAAEKDRTRKAKKAKAKGTGTELDLTSEMLTSKHHTIKITTSERKVKLWARNQHLIGQFEDSIVDMLKQTAWHQRHRFDSFAPVRDGVFAQWLVDGRDYMWNVSRAIAMAKDVIYIHDWWLSPELYMRRPAAISQKWRLDRLLQRKAGEGVKIFVIIYRNVEAAVPIDSEYTKFSLLNLHPNIFVQRSPNQFKKNQFFFAHHEKICVVDHDVAFLGGIDLCFGRWDSPQHTLVDDKPTGFEAAMDGLPKDADHCQLWPGKDYSNPRVQDFFSLREPYKEMYDRTRVPRMPWHDVGMQVVGQPARDLTRHFVQRWNYVRRGRKPTRPTPFLLPPPDFRREDLEGLGLSGTCEVQILRSASAWSLGVMDVECSIQTAYISMIEESDHFVYMENQFFITSTETLNVKIVNRIGDALVERIERAHRNDEDWRCVIIIPLMPGFEASVADQEGTSVRLILQCQYRSISRGENSIFGRLRAAGIEPEDYIQFFSLRQWGRINNKSVLTTEQLYIHAKAIIVDDRVALIGSANINERSLLGDRDSETAAIVRDRDMISSTMGGEPYLVGRFAHTLRMRLMQEHLGLDTDAIMEEDRQREAEFTADMDQIVNGAVDYGELARNIRLALSGEDDDDEEGESEAAEMQRKQTHDVEGGGEDRWSAARSIGGDLLRDSTVVDGREVLVGEGEGEGEGREKGKGKEKEEEKEEREDETEMWQSDGEAEMQANDHVQQKEPQENEANEAQQNEPPSTCPLAFDIRLAQITKECMRDPIDGAFYDDVWARVAENNTKIYRRVFRCMPDSEATNWHEFQNFTAYNLRFQESMENRKKNTTAEAEGGSRPNGVGEEAQAAKPEMEKAAAMEDVLKHRPSRDESSVLEVPNEKDKGEKGTERRATFSTPKISYDAADGNGSGNAKELLSKEDAETLLQLVQGHLVQFPYDWLSVEESNGNWLYQVDQVAPLQIYSVFVSAALLAASATAQTTSACAAENIVTACLSTENAQLASCGTSDWDCMCNAYVNIITCYNNCPDDTARNSAVGQKELYCSYASAYPSINAPLTTTETAAMLKPKPATTTCVATGKKK